MNIILLSGGSGKRLWPLSNDVRSKQFIKLFKNNDEYESMVQRVYRQVTTVDADAKITIATSKSQASAIKNQLGEKASICVEPCRRDTFPAIALAAAYLHDELGVAEDEAVVVCPVDPYVDNTYYEAVKTLQELAEQGNANLTLMGIEPTYPSEKYGYIIPESGDNVSKVKEFKEKPDVETARKYLAQSALWNAGIFAFKLGYLLDKAHSMIDFEDYRDLFNKYDTLTKISFDYAVVEKESSIQVLRYSGDWKDVGTWNMMAEVMADKTKGKAILDETCENTNVVNELNIPILCIERFALSITKELISDQSRSDIEYILVFKNEVHKEFAEEQHNVKKIIVRGKNKLIFNQLQLPLKLATIKADYYFFPAFPAPFFFFDRNAISAIHDVGCWDCPSKNKKYMTLYFKLMYRKAALGHKKVVTVSQFSKNRISKILKKESDEIAVIYDGLSDCFANFYYDRGQDMLLSLSLSDIRLAYKTRVNIVSLICVAVILAFDIYTFFNYMGTSETMIPYQSFLFK